MNLDAPKVPEVAPLVLRLLRRDLSGCCLRHVVADANVSDADVAESTSLAERRGCQECQALALILARMSRAQRRSLSDHAYLAIERERQPRLL